MNDKTFDYRQIKWRLLLHHEDAEALNAAFTPQCLELREKEIAAMLHAPAPAVTVLSHANFVRLYCRTRKYRSVINWSTTS